MIQKARRIKHLLAALSLLVTSDAFCQDQGRIEMPRPTEVEADRIASDIAMNDSLLQKGDIVVTYRGFFVFRGVGPDGYTFEFSPVPNPISAGSVGR
jgi:hypothetical protein